MRVVVEEQLTHMRIMAVVVVVVGQLVDRILGTLLLWRLLLVVSRTLVQVLVQGTILKRRELVVLG
jgi:hypothetical protein